ncbi:MAG: AbrB/MazE/SpoVT family DNA-binding domain-containing protein [Roseiarcus sp.]|jgi:bifunctional DNA-binding transcriptional regulator/antitoxin component of YhaV-PrlF toxin-antitoxin module
MRAREPKAYYSKLSFKSQTVLPREVRERLKMSPGDRLRYLVDDKGVRIEKEAPARQGELFATFSEWSSEADEETFADL